MKAERELSDIELGPSEPSHWISLYEMLQWTHDGIDPKDDQRFDQACSKADEMWSIQFSPQIWTYEHILLKHGGECSRAQLSGSGNRIPLGLFSNQRAEAEHHLRKLLWKHTFDTGHRKNEKEPAFALAEVFQRSLLEKFLHRTFIPETQEQ